ncbi:ras guanine nucleotide exchange factor domain-containing protein [Chiua virens]|nr:ras guanine nucleotide exchange factor domain-containing protein [Chiua virens]
MGHLGWRTEMIEHSLARIKYSARYYRASFNHTFPPFPKMLDARLRQCKVLPRISTDIPPLTKCSSDSSSCSSSPTTRSITPGTTPSTSDHRFFFHVLCMHDFESPDPDHLSFLKDEVLTIVKQEHSGWWAAMRSERDKVGWIPSSFVQPLDRSRIVQSDEESWSYESSIDHPLSAGYDPWVPVREDCKFQLVTPTDLVPYHFFDERSRDHNCEYSMNLSCSEQFSDMGDIRVPSTPAGESPLPHCPQRPFLSELEASQLTRPASPAFLRTALRRRSRPYDASPPFLTAPVNSDDGLSELTSGFESEKSFTSHAHESAATSQDIFHSARHNQRVSHIKSLELTIWDPHSLAKQLCVLMHALYATIRKNDCLNWMSSRRNTEVTGLRRFFDTHEHVASWVQLSVADTEMTRQADVLDFWIRVAEACQTLGNFDSFCAIVLVLAGSVALPSLESAWARCAYQPIFATLRNLVDASNKFHRLEDAMDAARGPCVPFVRKYLYRIKELQVDRSGNRISSFAADTNSTTACITCYVINLRLTSLKS